jgi:hypothetical protein
MPNDLGTWVTKSYENHMQWAQRLHHLHERLIQLNAETAAVLREIAEAERNELSAREFVKDTFRNWRDSLAASERPNPSDLLTPAGPGETQGGE